MRTVEDRLEEAEARLSLIEKRQSEADTIWLLSVFAVLGGALAWMLWPLQ